jgi:uncharacterized protein
MSIWAIADIHGSATDPETGLPRKPMDVFGPKWHRHVERLDKAWRENVKPDDTVLVVGDTDWALRLDGAMETLRRIDSWPGSKILIRGNHDYWWSSKTTNRVRRSLPPSLALLHNDAIEVEGFNICGTKGSPVPGGMDWTEENAKLLRREEHRLGMSLQAANPLHPIIVALHYPPFYLPNGTSSYRDLLNSTAVVACVYGHLHESGVASSPIGIYDGVRYALVAGDATDFLPVLVARRGELALAQP